MRSRSAICSNFTRRSLWCLLILYDVLILHSLTIMATWWRIAAHVRFCRRCFPSCLIVSNIRATTTNRILNICIRRHCSTGTNSQCCGGREQSPRYSFHVVTVLVNNLFYDWELTLELSISILSSPFSIIFIFTKYATTRTSYPYHFHRLHPITKQQHAHNCSHTDVP